MRSDLVSEACREFREALEDDKTIAFEDERYKRVREMLKNAAEEFEDALAWRLREAMPETLSAAVHSAAEKAIEAVLTGNEGELRRWLSCDSGCYNGRSDGYHVGRARGIEEMHPIIHGKLFETGAVALRKQIVDAHPDVLKNERILDLEDQLASVVAQFNKLKAERDHEQMRAF